MREVPTYEQPIMSQEHYELIPANNQSIADHTLELMCGQLALTRIPIGEPAVFDGQKSPRLSTVEGESLMF